MSPNRTSVLKYRGFKNVIYGQLISQFGDTLHFLVFLWWAGRIGGAAAAGLVGACSIGASVVLSLYTGTVADRVDRKRILFVSDLACGAVSLGMVAMAAFVAKPEIWMLCAFAVLLKFGYAFQMPARGAAVPRLVPEDRLLEANSLNMSLQTMMPVIGNALGAFVLGAIFSLSETLAYEFTFSVNAATFFISAMFMSKLPAIPPERNAAAKHPFAEAKDGLKFVFGHPIIRTATLVFTGFSFFCGPTIVAFVQSAQTTFASGFTIFGMTLKGAPLLALMEMGFFAGFVSGSACVYRRPITRAGVAFAIALPISGVLVAALGFVSNVPAFWVLNFLCGVAMPFGVIPLETLLQQETPDMYLGRMNATVGTLSAASAPLAMALAGGAIVAIGLDWMYAVMGLGLAAASLAGALSPSFRRSKVVIAATESVAEPQPEEPAPAMA